MKIVVCFDSFKGSLPAAAACRIAVSAIESVHPECEVVLRPLADGGEGSSMLLREALEGEERGAVVSGPVEPMQVEAEYALLPDGTAAIDIAEASGLPLIPEHRRNPLKATTRGSGELIAAAVADGARKILLCLGGSGTVDGGMGMAAVLGWRFLDAEGRDLPPGGGALERLARIVRPPEPFAVPVVALCDVNNPLVGPSGAARVFGPQKGATPEMVERLERGLERLADVVASQLGLDVRAIPGGGAAGGLGAGTVAFLGATLTKGIDYISNAVDLREAIRGADWILTGEGCLDATSLNGKVVSGVLRAGREAGVRVAVIAGQTKLTPETCRTAGMAKVLTLVQPGMTTEHAIDNASDLLDERCREFAASL